MNSLDKKYDQICTYYALIASHHFDKALIHAKCARPLSLDEAEKTSALINFIFSKETSPLEFLQPVDQKANEAIDCFQHYQNAKTKCMFDQRVLEGFAKWYANSGFEVAMIKCNIGYLLYIGWAILEFRSGKISEKQRDEIIEEIVRPENNIFSFRAGRVRKSFVEAFLKFREIENKVASRKQKIGIETE